MSRYSPFCLHRLMSCETRRMLVRFPLLALGLLLTAIPHLAFGLTELYDGKSSVLINKQVQIYREASGDKLSVEEVIKRRGEFTWPSSSNPNYGFSDKAIWFHSTLTNRSEESSWVVDIEFAQNQNVDFYLVANGQVVSSSRQGQVSGSQSHRIPSFNLELPFGQPFDLYIRVKSPLQVLVVPINVTPKAKFTRAMSADNIWWGMFYGGLSILIFYNLVLFFITREISLVAYICYISACLFWQFVWGGHSQLVLEPSKNQWFAEHTSVIFILVGLGAGFFTQDFLNINETAARTKLAIWTALGALGILFLAALTELITHSVQNYLVYGMSMIAIGCYMLAGIESYFNDFKPARYFVFAWSILLMTALIGLLGLVGFLPSNTFTTYCFQVGVFFEAAFFSVALIEKTRHKMEIDTHAVTRDLVNNMAIIEEQNVHLDIARKEAEKASRIKSQFLANMSHEIRTPLNAITGFSHELSKLSLPLEQQEHVQIINQSATNLLAIVNDVLDFSKIEAGKLQINEEAFSPGDLLEELVFVFAKVAQKKQLTFLYEPSALPKKLLADSARIKQVLTNLLSNAVKFTNRGSISLTVEVKNLGGDHLELVFRVEDTGIGIANEDQDKLFKSFSQLDDSLNRSYQGTGLGLVISQQLIQLMRGNLNYHSQPRVGSCFEMTVPCNQIGRHYDLEVSAEWRDKEILLFDRNPRSRLASAKIFHGLGAKVTSGSSLEWLKEQYIEFDYFFTDETTLEGLPETELVRLIRTLDANERVLLVDANGSSRGAYSEHFQRLFESPLLISRLLNFHKGEEQTRSNIWNERLFNLPAVKILAVDDMPINLRLLSTWLQESPIKLKLCYGGKDAVKSCQEEEFDLILMDVQMPDMDGLEATQNIRRTHLNQGTPVIAVTAHAFKEEQEKLLNSGMDDYLPKPLELGALLNVIQRWCSSPEHNITTLADIDWQLALSRANSSEKIANDLLNEFAQQLPKDLEDIEQAYRLQDWESMKQKVHRLHGASCYTGVPKLQQISNEVETELKEKHFDEARRKFPELKDAIESVLRQQASMTRT